MLKVMLISGFIYLIGLVITAVIYAIWFPKTPEHCVEEHCLAWPLLAVIGIMFGIIAIIFSPALLGNWIFVKVRDFRQTAE